MKNIHTNEYVAVQTHLEEDKRFWEANKNNDLLLAEDCPKKLKTYLIALEIKSHALLS